MKIILVSLLFISLTLTAQYDNLENYQNKTSLTIINPSLSGIENSVTSISNFTNISYSQLLYVNLSRYKNSKSGFSLYHYYNNYKLASKWGDNNSTALNYGHLFLLTRKLKLKLGAGLAQHTFYTYTPTNIFEKKNTLALKTGLIIIHKDFYIGVSGLNIPINTNINVYENRYISSIQGGYSLKIKKSSLKPSIILYQNKQYHNIIYNLKAKRHWLVLNLGYKNSQNELFWGAGIEAYKINFSYIYSRRTSNLNTLTDNKHTFMLAYKWKNRPKFHQLPGTPSF